MKTIKKKLEFHDVLTDHEITELAHKAVEFSDHASQLEAQKKASADKFKDQITAKEEALKETLATIKKGTKTVYADCEIVLNSPEDGKKTITRLDLPEDHIDTEDMKRTWITEMSAEDFDLFPEEDQEATEENDQNIDLFPIYGVLHEDLKDAKMYRVVESEAELIELGLDTEELPELTGCLVVHFANNEAIHGFIEVCMQGKIKFRRFGNYFALDPIQVEEDAE